MGSDNVSVIDGTSDNVVATIIVGDGSVTLFHNPARNKVYCSNVGEPPPGTPLVCTTLVIDGSSNQVVKTITVGDEPTAFCNSVHNQKVYWLNEWSHNHAVANAITNSIIAIR